MIWSLYVTMNLARIHLLPFSRPCFTAIPCPSTSPFPPPFFPLSSPFPPPFLSPLPLILNHKRKKERKKYNLTFKLKSVLNYVQSLPKPCQHYCQYRSQPCPAHKLFKISLKTCLNVINWWKLSPSEIINLFFMIILLQ